MCNTLQTGARLLDVTDITAGKTNILSHASALDAHADLALDYLLHHLICSPQRRVNKLCGRVCRRW